MSNLYDDLLSLQKIPDAFANWAGYRGALTGYIISHTEPGSTVLIAGAGPCNDLDLVRLCGHFSSVSLLDRDRSAMLEGLRRQKTPIPPQNVICSDLLGVSEDSYRSMADAMLPEIRREYGKADPDAQRIEKRLREELRRVYEGRKTDEPAGRTGLADYVVCCGLHSQLMTIPLQMISVYRRYVPFDDASLAGSIREQIPAAAARVNGILLGWAGRGVILGLERERSGVGGAIDGAWQAMLDMERRRYPVTARTRLEWPFDPARDKAYLMELMLICKDADA